LAEKVTSEEGYLAATVMIKERREKIPHYDGATNEIRKKYGGRA
jgi:hypothetical protein